MRLTLRERVWHKVRIPWWNLDECWLWEGACSHKRYNERRPEIRDGAKMRAVARVVCEWVHGAPPRGYHAGHTCPAGENALCVSPRHLEWQTPYQNRMRRDNRLEGMR